MSRVFFSTNGRSRKVPTDQSNVLKLTLCPSLFIVPGSVHSLTELQVNNFLVPTFSPPQYLLFQTDPQRSKMRYYCMFSMMVSAPSSLLLMNLYNWDVEHFLNSRHLHVEFGSLGLQELITLLMIIPAIQPEWITDFLVSF